MSRRRAPSLPDLFGHIDAEDRAGEVEKIMIVAGETEFAWLLRPGDRPDLAPKWAPKSQVKRAPPPDDDVFTIARWIARERGWL